MNPPTANQGSLRKSPTRGQQIALLALGTLLALTLLEVGLRVGGVLWSRAQNRENVARPSDRVAWRVLCLGESTTANGYPAILEETLNESGAARPYRVFNEGVVGTTSDQILARTPELLERYRPHAVVAMIGINDPKERATDGFLDSLTRPVRNLRLFSFYRLLAQHLGDRRSGIGHRPEEDPPGASDTVRQLIEQVHQRRAKQDFVAAESLLAQAASMQPDSYAVWRASLLLGIARGGQDRAELLQPARSHFLPRLQDDPGDLPSRLTLARLYVDVRAYGDARDLLAAAPAPAHPQERWQRLLATSYEFPSREASRTGDWDRAAALLEEGLDALPSDAIWIRSEFHARLARAEDARGNDERAAQHLASSAHLRRQLENSFTTANYRALHRLLESRNIPLIAVQYPTRDVGEVEEILEGRSSVVFVDNSALFDEAIATWGFWTIFEDEFAGDFGHMTTFGKRLLARNVAATVRQTLAPADGNP